MVAYLSEGRTSRTRGVLFGEALPASLLILGIRIWLLASYSSSVPSWDAWGAETTLYADWLRGEFQWSNLWTWHNEHRIFFTRVLDMLLFIGNQSQWDVRVQTLASSTLLALTAGGAVLWMRRYLDSPLSVVLSSIVVVAAILPCGWANTYAGFQSCFYFVLLFALLAIRNAAQSPLSLSGGMMVAVAALAAVFSLAAGVLATVAIAIVAIGRVVLERRGWARSLLFVVPVLMVCAWALVDARRGEVHPASIPAFLDSLVIMLSWPFATPLAMALWVPVGMVAAQCVRTRSANHADLVFGGLALWVLMFAAAAAYSRGYNFREVQSRYTDLMVPGLVAQVYFAFRLAGFFTAPQRGRLLAHASATAFCAVLVIGLARVAHAEFANWREYDYLSKSGALYVRDFMEGNASALEGRPHGHIPHPQATTLAHYLDAPPTAAILPLSLVPIARSESPGTRLCRWHASGAPASLPTVGSIRCGGNIAIQPGEVSVGPLSALTYWTWSWLNVRRYPTFSADSRSSIAKPDGVASCALDQVNGVPVVEASRDVPFANLLRLSGWYGPTTIGSDSRIRFLMQHSDGRRFVATGSGGIERADVATAAARPGFERAGFDQVLDGSSLPAGRYGLALENEGGSRCETAVMIVVAHDSDVRLSY